MKNSKVTYKQIIALALPIILGSAVQNIIAVSDSIFLYHYHKLDFQAIGVAGVFYLMITAIGFGFSKGGQILIARSHGAGDILGIKKSFYTLLAFELLLATILFLIIQLFAKPLLGLFVDDPVLLAKGVEYVVPRSYGIFFGYIGVAFVAFYTGISKPMFIVVDALCLLVVNLLLNYALIFGHWGMPSMGIAGAGWASVISEGIAFVIFVLYMIWERNPVVPKIFKKPSLEYSQFRSIFKISTNIVLQVLVGMGSWLVFFGIIENMGRHELGVSNVVRIIYLILSVPTWGFSSAMNTISSNLIGQNNKREVLYATHRTAMLNFLITLVLSVPVLVFPDYFLFPFFGGGENASMVQDAQFVFYVLLVILLLFAYGSVFFDSIIGLGKTRWGLYLKLITSVSYLVLLYYIVEKTNWGLEIAWATEAIYWFMVLVVSVYYLVYRDWSKDLSIS